jgi:hypothetical protein
MVPAVLAAEETQLPIGTAEPERIGATVHRRFGTLEPLLDDAMRRPAQETEAPGCSDGVAVSSA